MAKKQISAKQVGKNIIVMIDGVKHSKAIDTPEERQLILEEVKSYNEKNNATKLKAIIKSLSKDIPVKKETKEKTTKKIELVKEKPVEKEVVQKVQEEKTYTPPAPTYRRRGGEY